MKTISNEKMLERYNEWCDKPHTIAEKEFRAQGAIGVGFHGGYTTAMGDVQALIDELKKALSEASEALFCYGQHNWDCSKLRKDSDCDCGLESAIEKYIEVSK